MPFVEIDHCIKLEVLQQWGPSGIPIVNVLHAGKEVPVGPCSQDDCDVVASNAYDSWKTDVMPLLNNKVQLVAVRATALDSATGPQSLHTGSGPVAGSGGGTALPLSCCAVLSLYSNLRGRSHRGRVYLSGLDIGTIDPTTNGFKADSVAVLLTVPDSINNGIRGGLSPTGFELVVASRTLRSYSPWSHTRVSPIPRTQRRREAA